MRREHLDQSGTKQPHPTVKGAHVYMIEQITGKRKELRVHREAVMTFPDGGWITVQAHPKTGQLGIASYYNGPDRVDVLNELIAEQTEWLQKRPSRFEKVA